MWRRGVMCSFMLLAVALPLRADEPAGMAMPDIEAMMAAAGEGKGGGKKPGDLPDFEDVTKDMTSTKGLFTLWSYPDGAKDKDTEKLLCQIPSGFLGEQFMLSLSFSGGGFFTGFPLEERVVKWELHDKQLLLVEPQSSYAVNDGATVSDVIRRTYPDRIRVAAPILTKGPGGDPVIDLGPLLKSNFADIAWMAYMEEDMPFGRGGGINPQLSKWTKKKAFELNVEIGVELAVGRGSPPGSFDKKQVHYSFWKLPKSDYEPRIADERVGYFITTNIDWSKPSDSREIFNRYITRWNLKKRDPSLPLCEPEQPIVYYIEKTVPVKYRRAVRDGILEYNKSFEKIGFINAIEVRQQTDDNEWKDLDPEDMRYSFFRWIVSGQAFAMGPSRANPFTGQIYDADIIFDDSFVRSLDVSARRNLPSGLFAMLTDDPILKQFLEEHPQWKRSTSEWQEFGFGDFKEQERLRARMAERMRHRGHVGCDYATGMQQQLMFAGTVLAGEAPEVIDRLLYETIKEVVAHEVGHTLGLRHNFKASSIYTMDEIKRRRGTGEPTVGSVMDYNPVLFVGDKVTEGHFITPTVGPYDDWAIEYGYRPDDGTYKGKDADTADPADKKGEKGADLAAAKGDAEKDKGSDKPEAKNEKGESIPKDVLEKLPPDVRKMVEAKMGGEGPKPAAPGGKGPRKGGAAAPAGQSEMLQAIASRSSEPELAYATDEDTTFISVDPRSNRYDMGADPIDWSKERLNLVNKRLANVLEWGIKDGESWYLIRPAVMSLLFEKYRTITYVGRYIGGQYHNRARRGDTNAAAPLELVDPGLQRRAMQFIEESFYNDDFFNLPPEVLNHLASARWWHEGVMIDFRVDFPLHDIIAMYQWNNMLERLFPNTLRRIYDAERKTTAADRFTTSEYVQRLSKAVWGDSSDKDRVRRGPWTDASPFISSTRRSLQREYLGLMEPLVRTAPGMLMPPDIHAMLQRTLQKLHDQIGETLKGGEIDFASEAHLASCQSRIERMLKPELTEYE